MRLRTIVIVAAANVLLLCSARAAAPAEAKQRCTGPPQHVVAEVALPSHPVASVVMPDGCYVFTSVQSGSPTSPNGLAVIHKIGGDYSFERVVPLQSAVSGLALTHDGRVLAVADDSYIVFLDTGRVIDNDPQAVRGYFSDGSSAGTTSVLISPDDRLLFAIDQNDGQMTVINLEKARAEHFHGATIIGRVPLDESPASMAIAPDGKRLYVTSARALPKYAAPAECRPEGTSATAFPTNPQGVLSVIDVQKAGTDPANAVISRTPAGCNPAGVAVSSDGKTVWVAARDNGEVRAYATAALGGDAAAAPVASVSGLQGPSVLGIIDRGGFGVVGAGGPPSASGAPAAALSVFSLADALGHTPAITGTIQAKSAPRGIAQSPDGRTAFFTEYDTATLLVIDAWTIPKAATAPAAH